MHTNEEYRQLKQEFGLSHDGDSWSHVMHWHFTIADEMHFREGYTPEHWRFRPSPLGRSNDLDDYAANIVREIGVDALERFGNTLYRYARALKHAGQDY